jgi:ankyrin repeat protein
VAALLVSKGADIRVKTKKGQTPMDLAKDHDNLEVCATHSRVTLTMTPYHVPCTLLYAALATQDECRQTPTHTPCTSPYAIQ